MKDHRSIEFTEFSETLKNGIWLFGISAWVFGIIDRSLASYSDGYLSAIELVQLCTAGFFFISWIFLKPTTISAKRL